MSTTANVKTLNLAIESFGVEVEVTSRDNLHERVTSHKLSKLSEYFHVLNLFNVPLFKLKINDLTIERDKIDNDRFSLQITTHVDTIVSFDPSSVFSNGLINIEHYVHNDGKRKMVVHNLLFDFKKDEK